MLFPYELKIEEEEIEGVKFRVECLRSLDATIDLLFEHFQRSGNPSLIEEYCPYFGVIWASGRALARFLARTAGADLKGFTVLEVGCGLALPSLAARRLGADVTATDSHPDVPVFLERNMEHNGLSGIEYRNLDWSCADEFTGGLGPFDWVVGSDILYERQQPALVAPVLDRMCAPGGHVLLADPGRPYLQEFVDLMKERGFTSSTRIEREPDGDTYTDVFLLSFERS